jgi:ADP-L-glycero-D-manno-heptose 6-epimerase
MKNKLYDDQLIVITGAAGMIGSSVVKYLNDQGHSNLLLVDDLDATHKWKNLIGKSFVDLIRIEELFPFLEGREREISAFIHLGACSDTLEKNGSYLMDNNYRFSVKLAAYALTHGQRFIYASSAATYGDGSQGFSDDPARLRGLAPLNLYGFSKHLFDLWLEGQGVLGQVVGLKYFNVFGPNENDKGRMASMVYKMHPLIQKEGVIRLFQSTEPDKFGDGDQCRDFIYVKDAARITCELLSNDICGIFNVGRGEGVTWNRLAKSVFHAMDLDPVIEYIPMPDDLKKQYQNYTCADMTRLVNEREKEGLGPLCEYSVEEGVFDYVRNYLAKDERW